MHGSASGGAGSRSSSRGWGCSPRGSGGPPRSPQAAGWASQGTGVSRPIVIASSGGKLVTSSRDVARYFGKEHYNVIRDINALISQAPGASLNFEACPYQAVPGGREYPAYQMDRDGFTLLAMGFTPSRYAAMAQGTPCVSKLAVRDSHDVRVMMLRGSGEAGVDGAPWWVASDVCRALGVYVYGGKVNVTEAMKKLQADEVWFDRIELTAGYPRKHALVSESGLYKLIMRSDKPEAWAFQGWVTRVVLPAIRKDGAYDGRART
ncbi:Rha family transcriptional regulator [Xanthobacter sp. V0B-10]|uniref:Rha family transcriptional regulator n=1 Tax=Xanthobacter albus TaxID=3119929 RepID=UPI003729E4EA